jgi:hypothetical protein
MSAGTRQEKTESRKERFATGDGGIFGEDYLELSSYPNDEYVLLMCCGLEIHAVSLKKKRLLELAKMIRRFAMVKP